MAASFRLPGQPNSLSIELGSMTTPPSISTQILTRLTVQQESILRDPFGYVSPRQDHRPLDRSKRRSSVPVPTNTKSKPQYTSSRTMVTPAATPDTVPWTDSPPLRPPPTPPPNDNLRAVSSTKSTIRRVPSTDIFRTTINDTGDRDHIYVNEGPDGRSASLSSIRAVSAMNSPVYTYPPAKALPQAQMPSSWNAQHDRFICIADAKGEQLSDIVARLRDVFPNLGAPVSMGLVDKRLRMLDMRHEGYWKEGLAMAEEASGDESCQGIVMERGSKYAKETVSENTSGDRTSKERMSEISSGDKKRKTSSGLPVPVGSKAVRRSSTTKD